MKPHAARPNLLAGSPLDRAAHRRADAGWITARLADPRSLFIPLWRSESLIGGTDAAPAAALPRGADLAAQPAAAPNPSMPWAFLGLWEGQAAFALDLSAEATPLSLLAAPGSARFADLRQVAAMLDPAEAALLAHARGLMHWRARSPFCCVCGSACQPDAAGNVLRCGGCGAGHFPRTDAAVIMLVTRDDKVLLGHATRFPNSNLYSILAGFVEPGESLEEAVAREVLEETGVLVGAVRYHSSQPWPFPASLMVGFTAEALTEEVVVDADELQDARWFTRAELRDPAAHGISLPGPVSIARRLITDWLEER